MIYRLLDRLAERYSEREHKLEAMRARGETLSALHAFLVGLYRPMGWEWAGSCRNYTLPLAVATFQSEFTQNTAAVFAFTALSMIPALTIFVFAQRYLVGGLVGAIRG